MSGSSMAAVVERLEAFDVVSADRDGLRWYMGESARLQAWKDARDARVAAAMRSTESWPEHAIGEVQQVSLREAERLLRRAELLDEAPGFAAALGEGRITAAHVDVLANRLRGLEPAQRNVVLAHAEELLRIAGRVAPDTFRRELKTRVGTWAVVDEQAVFEEQVRSTSLRTWEDAVTGMWCLHAEFDPVSAVKIDAAIRGLVESMFRDKTPALAPSDPLLRQQHLAALALKELILNPKAGGPAKVHLTGVVDLSDGPSEIVWDLPVHIPRPALDALLEHATIECVIVCNGRVLYAPGKLDEGRDKRVATRAQRRALRALYRGCGMPGCSVPFHRAKIHHVLAWEHGGLTNLDNLLPLCPRCHHAVHDKGWILELGPNRELTVRLPDGSVLSTGPPSRRSPAA